MGENGSFPKPPFADLFALVMHWAIFWGMAVLALGTALATIDQDFTNLPLDIQVLRGKFYCLFELALDVFGAVLILGLGMAASAAIWCVPNDCRRHAPG